MAIEAFAQNASADVAHGAAEIDSQLRQRMARVVDLIVPRSEKIVQVAAPKLLRPHSESLRSVLQRQRVTPKHAAQFAKETGARSFKTGKID